jgi:hypothetical protein
LELAKKDPNSLEATAKTRGYSVAGPYDISRANPSSAAFAQLTSDMSTDAFSSPIAPRALSRTFKTDTGYLVVVVSKVTKPDLKVQAATESIKKYRDEATQRQAQEALTSTVARLKLSSNVDIDQSLLTR